MAMRRSVTLIELIFVLVIISFLSVATFKALHALAIRSYKAREITRLSLEAQMVVDQIAQYLSARVPATVIGYSPSDGKFEYIGDLTTDRPILEWYGRAIEAYKEGNYSGFVDMAASDKESRILVSPDSDGDALANTTGAKFGISGDIYNDHYVELIFAGAYDRGSLQSDYDNAFGWHGGEAKSIYEISMDNDGNITITDSIQPHYIYERYFIVDSAYAIARGADIDKNAPCIANLGISDRDIDDTLFLFYNYRPWRGKTFCADPQGSGQAGDVAILMQHVAGFSFWQEDRTIRIDLDIQEDIRGSDVNVSLSKQKVVF